MQLLKYPFYYNFLKLDSILYQKILNYSYYVKFIFCHLTKLIIGTKLKSIVKLKFSKRKSKRFKKRMKLKVELFLIESFFSTFSFIEYYEDDFFLKNKVKHSLGFSYNYQEKYFVNQKILNHDFLEKYFKFNSSKNFLLKFYKNLKRLSLQTKYKLIIPLKSRKGGFIVFGSGFFGFLKSKNIYKITFSYLFMLINAYFYAFPSFSFIFSKLQIFIKLKFKKKRLKLRKKVQLLLSL